MSIQTTLISWIFSLGVDNKLLRHFIYLDLAIRTNTCLCIIDEVMIILAGDLLCKSQCLDRDCDRPHPRHHHRPPPQNTLWEEPSRSDLTIARSKYPLAYAKRSGRLVKQSISGIEH